ncbi:MAG: hypothetical protein ABIY55_20035 [Kofleriaceae bacterium]
MKDVAPGTQSKAKLGMCIVNWLRERVGVNARIGGSLSAAMFGGRRVPRDIDIDIDIDIPGKVVELNEARGRFFDLIKRPNFALATGTDLFFLVGWAKTPEGFEIAYHQVQTKTAIDPMDDESEVEKILKQTHAPVSKVSVDFSSETAFSSSGIHRGDCRPSGHRPSR